MTTGYQSRHYLPESEPDAVEDPDPARALSFVPAYGLPCSPAVALALSLYDPPTMVCWNSSRVLCSLKVGDTDSLSPAALPQLPYAAKGFYTSTQTLVAWMALT
jgi:hypothetical protein